MSELHIKTAADALNLFENASDGGVFVFVRSADGECSFPYVSPGFADVFGLPADDISAGGPQALLQRVHGWGQGAGSRIRHVVT